MPTLILRTLILRTLMEIDIDIIKAHIGGKGGLYPAWKSKQQPQKSLNNLLNISHFYQNIFSQGSITTSMKPCDMHTKQSSTKFRSETKRIFFWFEKKRKDHLIFKSFFFKYKMLILSVLTLKAVSVQTRKSNQTALPSLQ